MSTIIVTCVTQQQVKKAKRVLAYETMHNPRLNGADYTIKHDAGPDAVESIDSEKGELDQWLGAELFASIFNPDEGENY